MSLIKGYVNALNTLDARRIKFIPKHFAKMTLNIKSEGTKDIIDVWMYQNLSSRYAIKESLTVDSNNKVVKIQEIGVEDPKELTILSLTCPHLNK